MTLIKYNNRNSLLPWTNDSLTNFFNTGGFFNTIREDDNLIPAMNVKEKDDCFDIEFAAPGFSKKDFEVTIDDDILHIRAENKKESEESEAGYVCKEFSYNSFKKSLKLPSSVNTDQNVKATYQEGILKLHLQKKEELEEATKKVIEVM